LVALHAKAANDQPGDRERAEVASQTITILT
jgi:hypothetical protein